MGRIFFTLLFLLVPILGVWTFVTADDYGWWFPERYTPDFGWDESNINVITDDGPPLDPGMGATNLKGLMCRIERLAS